MDAHTILLDTVVVLGAAVTVLFLTHRLRLPSVVGLVGTGVLIGPSGIGIIDDRHDVELLAEIGVVLLLFVIGLELSLDKLRELRRPFLLGGSVQGLVSIVLAAALGAAVGLPVPSAIFLGLVAIPSSTAILLKVYAERRESDAPHGRVALAILLFQDILIVPIIVLTPVLAGGGGQTTRELLAEFSIAFVVIAGGFLLALWLVPRLLHALMATRSRELSVLAALGLCLAMAWGTFEMGFSLALGAFLAGLVVSESEYGLQAMADVAPFRDVFASLFFASVGMLIDFEVLAGDLYRVILLAAFLIAAKGTSAALATRLLGFPARVVVLAGLGLAQIGEFAFVVLEEGRRHGLLGEDTFQLFLASSVITMVLAPGLVQAAPWVAQRLLGERGKTPEEDGASQLTGHVIIVGFGTAGNLLVRVLQETRIPHIVVEISAETVRRAKQDGVSILYGDASRPEVLEHAGLERARIVVFAISDADARNRGVAMAHRLAPDVPVLVRTRRVDEIEQIRELGAQEVVAEEFETAIEIFTRVLRRLHMPRNVIRAQTRLLRGESYRMLRAESLNEEASEAVLRALEEGAVDVFQLAEGQAAVGQTLRELDLRRRTGASVLSMVRGERSYPNPPPDTALSPGDSLVLMGGHAEVDAAFRELGRGPDAGALEEDPS
ncbi:MAG: cation:proton antiporter [Thermoanaerobaculia bacterium]|nr:cation:proton antiporter [Thermoanaerobaculia bacterium]